MLADIGCVCTIEAFAFASPILPSPKDKSGQYREGTQYS